MDNKIILLIICFLFVVSRKKLISKKIITKLTFQSKLEFYYLKPKS